jgi:hypothetical protein
LALSEPARLKTREYIQELRKVMYKDQLLKWEAMEFETCNELHIAPASQSTTEIADMHRVQKQKEPGFPSHEVA